MLAYTYVSKGQFALLEKPKPILQHERDAIVRVTLGSICTSDLHIKHGSVPRAVPGITVGHEMVGVVEQVGAAVTHVKPGDRVTDLQALLVGDVLATGYWAAKISEIQPDDTVLILGAGPTGLCTLQCVRLKKPQTIIVCDVDQERLRFVREHYPEVLTTTPEQAEALLAQVTDRGGADVVLEVAGGEDTFQLAWQLARPNAIVTVVALYDRPQILPLPQMYGKNLTFKTGGVDGCNCAETLELIRQGKLDTVPLITHTYSLKDIEAAYDLFENRRDGVIKVAIEMK